MSVRFPYRVTIAPDPALMWQANQLALCFGTVPADAETFGELWAVNASGDYFVYASAVVPAAWLAGVSNPAVAPGFAPGADVAAARAAQAVLDVAPLSAPVPAALGRIAAITGPNAPDQVLSHLAALGLTPAPAPVL